MIGRIGVAATISRHRYDTIVELKSGTVELPDSQDLRARGRVRGVRDEGHDFGRVVGSRFDVWDVDEGLFMKLLAELRPASVPPSVTQPYRAIPESSRIPPRTSARRPSAHFRASMPAVADDRTDSRDEPGLGLPPADSLHAELMRQLVRARMFDEPTALPQIARFRVIERIGYVGGITLILGSKLMNGSSDRVTVMV